MKTPKYFIGTMQQALDAGLNAFAFQLLAESFADHPEKFGDDNLALLFHAHNGQQVWFLMTKTAPKDEDFDPPEGEASMQSRVDPGGDVKSPQAHQEGSDG